jgi:hypothetical protein
MSARACGRNLPSPLNTSSSLGVVGEPHDSAQVAAALVVIVVMCQAKAAVVVLPLNLRCLCRPEQHTVLRSAAVAQAAKMTQARTLEQRGLILFFQQLPAQAAAAEAVPEQT